MVYTRVFSSSLLSSRPLYFLAPSLNTLFLSLASTIARPFFLFFFFFFFFFFFLSLFLFDPLPSFPPLDLPFRVLLDARLLNLFQVNACPSLFLEDDAPESVSFSPRRERELRRASPFRADPEQKRQTKQTFEKLLSSFLARSVFPFHHAPRSNHTPLPPIRFLI